MRARSPRIVSVLAVLAVALVAAAGAGAAPDGPALRHADTTRLPLVRLVVAAPGTSAQDPPTFAVRENGAAVSGVEVSNPDAPAAIGVAIDTSQSMVGDPLTRALGAAAGFAADKRPVDEVAVVGFAEQSAVAQELTPDTTTLRDAIGALALGETKGTALYDGIRDAIEATASADPASRRVVIVLTDGADTSSTTTLEDVITQAQAQGVVVHAIAVDGKGADPEALTRITRETGGTLRTAESGELAGLYDAIAAEIASTYVLSYRSTAHDAVSLELAVDGTALTYGYEGTPAPVARGPEDGLVPRSVTARSWSAPVLGVLVAVLMFFAALRLFPAHPRRSLIERLEPYDDHTQKIEAVRAAERARAGGRAITVATERVLGQLRPWKALGAALDRADVPLRPAELFYLMLGAGLLLAVPMTLLGVPLPVRLMGLAVGFYMPFMLVRMKAAKREKAFDAQLPDVLVAMAASLKAGHSFNQAVDAIIRDGTEPAKKEFGRAANQIRLGRSADEALEDMAHRLNSKNFEFVVLCVNIQRQVGGSLAELLDSVAETVRQRQQFARKVKALIAMGKMSAYALIALPFLMAGVISIINPDYMTPLFETSTGNVMLGMAGTGILLGTLLLKKIVSFKVD